MLMRLAAGGAALFAISLLALLDASAQSAGEFPYDQEMILDAKRIGGVKRLPVLTVDPDGNARIDLWCQTVEGRVTLSGDAIKIEAPPLPDALPSMMVPGQCSPERLQADRDLMAALAQVSTWGRQNGAVVLNGPTALRFFASSH